MIERFVLFTNLSFVTVNGVRTFTHALLLQQTASIFDETLPDRRLRGFGVVGAMPTFDMMIPSLEFSWTPAASRDVFVSDASPEPRPLLSGAIMKIAGGPDVQLVSCNDRKEIRVDRFEGEAGERVVLKVWEELPILVASFWTAPYMPHVRHLPKEMVRQTLEIERAR